MKDNGGRRRVVDRRRYSSSDHFPERRAVRFRRSDRDRRRSGTALKIGVEKRRDFMAEMDAVA